MQNIKHEALLMQTVAPMYLAYCNVYLDGTPHYLLCVHLKDDCWIFSVMFSLLHIEIIMWNNINHWHKNTQLELFVTLLSCNYNTTISIKTNRSISIKTNRSITWTLPMMSPSRTSWNIDIAETTKLGGWLVFSLGLLMFRLVDS